MRGGRCEAAEWDYFFGVVLSGEGDADVDGVTADKPDDHKDSKHDVAERVVTEVFEHFCCL